MSGSEGAFEKRVPPVMGRQLKSYMARLTITIGRVSRAVGPGEDRIPRWWESEFPNTEMRYHFLPRTKAGFSGKESWKVVASVGESVGSRRGEGPQGFQRAQSDELQFCRSLPGSSAT